jgi:CTP synthase
MVLAAQYAREHAIPYLGVCLGSQVMAIEFARNVLGYKDAHSEEFLPEGKHNVVHLMEHQRGVEKKGGTMRLGSYDCKLDPESIAFRLYGKEEISERHRQRCEFNNTFREEFENN